jgi:hypothetical protein
MYDFTTSSFIHSAIVPIPMLLRTWTAERKVELQRTLTSFALALFQYQGQRHPKLFDSLLSIRMFEKSVVIHPTCEMTCEAFVDIRT